MGKNKGQWEAQLGAWEQHRAEETEGNMQHLKRWSAAVLALANLVCYVDVVNGPLCALYIGNAGPGFKDRGTAWRLTCVLYRTRTEYVARSGKRTETTGNSGRPTYLFAAARKHHQGCSSTARLLGVSRSGRKSKYRHVIGQSSVCHIPFLKFLGEDFISLCIINSEW